MDERTLARFMAKVEVLPNGCWRWRGKPNQGGYGRFTAGNVRRRAHRWSYEHYAGPIPDGYEVDHLCHNQDLSCPGGDGCPHRLCVNPAHLEAVTHRENILRGHTMPAANAVKTRCSKGHLLDEQNTYWHRGTRRCLICKQERTRQWNASIVWEKPKHADRTHCPQGHPYDEANTYVDRDGHRSCRACKRERARERRALAKRTAIAA